MLNKMKLSKENVYINIKGKTKGELADLYNFLKSVGERQFRTALNDFLVNCSTWIAYELSTSDNWVLSSNQQSLSKKTEVTIEQLKELLHPTEEFTKIAMRCTQEQFDAIKPKLKGVSIGPVSSFTNCNYLVNNYSEGKSKTISNVIPYHKENFNREVHEYWNEEIFLKACGIKIETNSEDTKASEMLDLLKECKLQLEYLNEKFTETGTTNSLLSKIEHLIKK